MNIKDKHIVILGATRFDQQDQSTTFTMAKLLAEDNFIYYVDYPYTWKDYFRFKGTTGFNNRRPYFSLKSDGVLSCGIKNFKVIIVPVLLSINFLPEGLLYRFLLKFNEMLIRKRIKKVLRKNNINDFIYINSFNFHYPDVADTLAPALTVYHCVDPTITPYDKKHGIRSERILVEKSDLVICTSRQLYNEKRILNPNTFFIPNAADIHHFSKALKEDLRIHRLLSSVPKPVIGYIGAIERRMDYDLLEKVTKNSPDKTFIFAGSVSSEYIADWMYTRNNVLLVGPIPYHEIPEMLKGFDVAIIPFKKDEVSSTIFPLKLFEYLGAGKPVVATDFNPDLAEFTRDSVTYCENAEDFIQAIDDSLKNDSRARIEHRLSIARENTWENRVDEIKKLLYSGLKITE